MAAGGGADKRSWGVSQEATSGHIERQLGIEEMIDTELKKNKLTRKWMPKAEQWDYVNRSTIASGSYCRGVYKVKMKGQSASAATAGTPFPFIAVKVVDVEKVKGDGLCFRQIQREAHALAALEHPHIVEMFPMGPEDEDGDGQDDSKRFLPWFTDDGKWLFLPMELCEKGTLGAFIKHQNVGDGGGGGGDDGSGGDGRISARGPGPYPIAPRDQISRSGTSPHSDNN